MCYDMFNVICLLFIVYCFLDRRGSAIIQCVVREGKKKIDIEERERVCECVFGIWIRSPRLENIKHSNIKHLRSD